MKIETVIFDLDGTITRPALDFDEIRAEIGGISGPILEALEQMGPEQRDRAEEILGRHEAHAAKHSQLNPGVHDVCGWLRERRLAIGLVTRNQRRSVEHVCRKHNLAFDSVVTREDGPVKPDPFPVQHACEMMGVSCEHAVVVGDYLFDLVSARRAGAHSVLLADGADCLEFQAEADYVISSLGELPEVITTIEEK